MKFLALLFPIWWRKSLSLLRKENSSPKTIEDYNREALIKQGADQFKKLIDQGLNIPVAHL